MPFSICSDLHGVNSNFKKSTYQINDIFRNGIFKTKIHFQIIRGLDLCNILMSPDLTKADIFHTKYTYFLGTVNKFLIYNLFLYWEMHLSMNLLEYLLDKNISLVFEFQSKT